MKKNISIGLSFVFLVFGLCLIPSALYNICGVVGGRDCADGPKWESALVALFCIAFIGAVILNSVRIFRKTFPKNNISN